MSTKYSTIKIPMSTLSLLDEICIDTKETRGHVLDRIVKDEISEIDDIFIQINHRYHAIDCLTKKLEEFSELPEKQHYVITMREFLKELQSLPSFDLEMQFRNKLDGIVD